MSKKQEKVVERIPLLDARRETSNILGCLCNDPSIIKNKTIILKPRDFVDTTHRLMFAAINNIANTDSGIKKITSEDIDNFLSAYPNQYEAYNRDNGYEYLNTSISSSNEDTFLVSYKRFKKCSLLRHYHQCGFDISEIYDYKAAMKDFMLQSKINDNLEKKSEKDIINHFTLKAAQARDSWDMLDSNKSFNVKEKIVGFTKRKKDDPRVGMPYYDLKYNYVFRGRIPGNLFLRSADTGNGKSRLMEAEIAHAACEWIREPVKGWMRNHNREKCLYISTELTEDAILSMMLASITGIGTNVIGSGKYNDATAKILEEGENILSNADIFIEEIQDFDTQDIENLIEKAILDHGVTMVAFDYIQVVPKMAKSMIEQYGYVLREDVMLVNFASDLKKLAEKYQVFITTSTQLSRSEFWDARRLAGGKATANKPDQACIITKMMKEQHQFIAPVLEEHPHLPKPNYATYVFKNREGIDTIILWSKMDLSCARSQYCFATDYNGEVINIPDMTISTQLTDYNNSIIQEEANNKFEEIDF